MDGQSCPYKAMFTSDPGDIAAYVDAIGADRSRLVTV